MRTRTYALATACVHFAVDTVHTIFVKINSAAHTTHACGSYGCKLPRIDGQFVAVVAIGALIASVVVGVLV